MATNYKPSLVINIKLNPQYGPRQDKTDLSNDLNELTFMFPGQFFKNTWTILIFIVFSMNEL